MQVFISMCRVFTCSGVGRDTGQRSTGRPYHDHRGGSGSPGSSTDSCGRLDGRIIAGVIVACIAGLAILIILVFVVVTMRPHDSVLPSREPPPLSLGDS